MRMTTHRQITVGVFERPEQAGDALLALKEAGFPADDISIITPERETAEIRARAPATTATGYASGGAVIGGLLGVVVGWLGALGALAIPGVGPVLGAGALAAMAGGSAVGMSVGALGGALVALGVRDEEATWYEHELRRGGTLVAVAATGRHAEARHLLDRAGAYDYETRGAHPL
jgi:hypothetical protein